jgi:hypothetical protein
VRARLLPIRLAGLASLVIIALTPPAIPRMGGAWIASAEAAAGAPRDSLRRSVLPRAVWAARDSIAAMLSGRPELTVVPVSGRFPHPYDGSLLTGCWLTIHGSFDEKTPPEDALSLIGQYFERTGWQDDGECSADGPDGTLWGVRRAGVRCLVGGRWDGGDDSDSTYVPSPEYDVTVDCLVDCKNICPH